ncbi:SIS domain-containing protein [Paenibacillus gansuensis]|uniref:Glutamine--fructose-6-phosphate aminotransferase [isomerizing] n=1 Tax=Paenibacillus gansuensis TaxID=306542 RepID=A0ABW5PAM2_9BACL
MRQFIDDMQEQPNILQKIADYYEFEESLLFRDADQWSAGKYQRIVFAGMGSSYAASRLAGNYLWSMGIPAFYMEASELLHYGMHTIPSEALLVLISQSGESIEVKEILRELPPATDLIGITNDPASTLGKSAKWVLPLLAGEESTTSSKTYTATLAVTLLLCNVIAKRSLVQPIHAIRTAASAFESVSGHLNSLPWDEITNWLIEANAIYLIGRGPAVSTAFQGALTFKELVKVPAESMEAAQFRHGPLETVNENTVVFVFASPAPTRKLALSFVTELVACGAKVIVIEQGMAVTAHNKGRSEASDATIDEVDEYFAALLDIYPVQRAANDLAERLGISGEFKWISKVTQKQ